MALPTQTPEQRAANLEKGRATRMAQREVCEKLKSGEVPLSTLLGQVKADPEHPAAKMPLKRVLGSLPKIGTVKIDAICIRAKVDPKHRLKSIAGHQRQAVLDALWWES